MMRDYSRDWIRLRSLSGLEIELLGLVSAHPMHLKRTEGGRGRTQCVEVEGTECWSEGRAKLRAVWRHLARGNTQHNLALPSLQHSVLLTRELN